MPDTDTKSAPANKTAEAAAKRTDKLADDPRFKWGPAPIQTPEDATQAYLTQAISEEEYREALGRFGKVDAVVPATLVEPIDIAFERKIPDDLRDGPTQYLSVEGRQKVVDAKQEVREEALENDEEAKKKEEEREKLQTKLGENSPAAVYQEELEKQEKKASK